jgi:hypothetical protein
VNSPGVSERESLNSAHCFLTKESAGSFKKRPAKFKKCPIGEISYFSARIPTKFRNFFEEFFEELQQGFFKIQKVFSFF